MAHRYWRSRTLTPFDRRTKVAPGFTKLTQLLPDRDNWCLHA
ncbi:hypothetical protein AtDm6_1162 [Acetobacter tropicalis]|uniref:Uncharacterized protein n=1 Tax=Acetobacter tropicalis TaxID=104102 RepID=A0A094YV04_9PROT|nr:hypothetical protein AtDm6_1162 [Acetobacter tropicalis]